MGYERVHTTMSNGDEGLDPLVIDLGELASELKSSLAVGGTVEDGQIELQGDYGARVLDLLEERGFEVE